ncbi:uncharacterized protein LOC62_03G003902 [Vanrija pseudolonga]|uniref:BTB domain-containing protein n=1 Tax=Vanrija pseudolonga TaxID=143232 RepID=A0AAF1BQ50_9TREE|nr:hypothetical protein LOC62_03G003902 [Vanrija pseudolonga]
MADPSTVSLSPGRSKLGNGVKRARGESEAAVPVIKDHPVWNKGDFALISADNVRFRIDHHYLLSASVFFRDLRDVASNVNELGELVLDDPIIETAPTVHNFLVVITQGYISPPRDARPLGLFFRKYLCVAGMNILEGYIKRSIETDKQRSIECFVIAAALDNLSLCLDAIEHHDGTFPSECADADGQGPLGYIPGSDTYSPQNLPYAWRTYMPAEYLWALHRAWAVAKDTPQMMSTFRDLVRSVREWDKKNATSRDGRAEICEFYVTEL